MKFMRAVALMLKLVRKPWDAKSDHPFDNISWATAWEVARDIYLRKAKQ